MASAIDFGRLSSTSGTPRLSGTSSGLDTEALIGAMVEAKRIPALRLESRVTRNEAKLAALDELRGLLGAVKDAASGLRNPPGFLGARDNLFESKEAYYSSSTTTSPATLLAVRPDATADTGTYEVVVHQIATARKFMGDAVASPDLDLATGMNGGVAFSGSFTLGLDGGATSTIAVDGTMDLNDVRAAINAVSGTSGVSASVVTVSPTESRLVLSANEPGREVSMAPAAGDAVLATLGLSADGGVTVKNPIQAALKARVEIDGLMVERTGNRIDDAVPGMTLELYRAEPGTTVTVEVGRALGGAKESIGTLVGALNDLRSFVERNSRVDDAGSVDEGAVLFGDTTLRSIANAVNSVLSNRVEGLAAGAAASLGALGISIDAGNRLVVDDSRLDSRLLGDLASVRGVFEFTFTTSSPDLALFNRTGALADTAFTVDIVDANADGLPESASIGGIALTVDGGTLIGPAGSAYEGLELIWSGAGSTSIDVTATQGIAERLFTTLEATLDLVDGELATSADSLETLNERHLVDIERIESRAEDYRQRLIERFAVMESALSLAKAMLEQVRTTTEAMFADS